MRLGPERVGPLAGGRELGLGDGPRMALPCRVNQTEIGVRAGTSGPVELDAEIPEPRLLLEADLGNGVGLSLLGEARCVVLGLLDLIPERPGQPPKGAPAWAASIICCIWRACCLRASCASRIWRFRAARRAASRPVRPPAAMPRPETAEGSNS